MIIQSFSPTRDHRGMSSSNAPVFRHAVVLGLLTTIGPFAIDMYLPALPAIGRALNADPHAMQASLMAFFIAVGAGQLVAGPLSDMFGRRRPMVAGLVLFMLACMVLTVSIIQSQKRKTYDPICSRFCYATHICICANCACHSAC